MIPKLCVLTIAFAPYLFSVDLVSEWPAAERRALAAKEKGEYAEAEKQFKVALALAEQFGNRDLRLENTLTELGAVLQVQSKLREAEPVLVRALAIRTQLFPTDSLDVAFAKNNLSAIYQQMGQMNQARTLQEEALVSAEKVLPPSDPRLVPYLTHSATLQRATGGYAEAEKLLNRALAIAEKTPADARTTAMVLRYRAATYSARQLYDRAEADYRRALALLESALGRDHAETLGVLCSLGDMLVFEGKIPDALPLLTRAAGVCETHLLSADRNCIVALNNLAAAEKSLGRTVQAEQHCKQAWNALEASGIRSSPLEVIVLNNLGQIFTAERRFKDAEKILTQALDVAEKVSGKRTSEYASTLGSLATVLESQHKYAKAEPLAREALDIDTNAGAPDAKKAKDVAHVGTVLCGEKRYAEAEAALRRSIEMETGSNRTYHPALATPILNLAAVLRAEKKDDEAVAMYKKGIALLIEGGKKDTPEMAAVLDNYSQLMRERKEYADAEQASTEALGIRVRRAVHADSLRSQENL